MLVELRDAQRSGTHCCSLWQVAQGAAMLASLSHDVRMNARSTLMMALRNEGDSKRKVQGVRFGLRECRIGEARSVLRGSWSLSSSLWRLWPTLASPILANPFLANPFFLLWLWFVLVWESVLCCLFLLVCWFGPPSAGPPAGEGTDFGQSRFGHLDLTNFGQANLGQSNLGQSNFGQSLLDLVCVMVGPKGVVPNPEKIWPEVMGPEVVGPRRVGGPNCGGPGSFRGILVVFEAPVRSNVHVWSSRVVV